MDEQILEPQSNEEASPKELHLSMEDVNTFAGIKTIDQVITNLLSEIKPLDFRTYLGLAEGVEKRQKYLIVGVVKKLLEVSREKNWNLAKVYEYIYLYNGCYWQQLEKDELKTLLGKAAIAMGVPDYDACHFEFKKKLFEQFLTDAHLKRPAINSDRVTINLVNGTFEFDQGGGSIRPFNPNDFNTYQLPFEYDPCAKSPMFDKYLIKVLPDADCRKVLQEYSGYIFSGLNLEKILVLNGGGANGKSVFFNVLCALIGKENVLNFTLGQFSSEYNRAKLTNILLNYSSEKGSDLDPDTLKGLASMEPLQAREPYGKPFTLYPRTRFIINMNEYPQITEQTDAYHRRFLIIPFEVKIAEDERDIDLADKIIQNELPGVFNWLLQGLIRIQENKKFTISEKIIAALADFKKQTDNTALFIEEKRLIKSDRVKQSIKELYSQYKTFCSDDGHRPLGKTKFAKRLEYNGFIRTRVTGGDNGFFIEVNPEEEIIF